MSERTEEIAGSLSRAASELATLRGLVEHPGWKVYRKILQGQQNSRKGEVLLKPVDGVGGAFAQEFMKGEISGLALAEIGAHAQIDVLESEIRGLRLLEEKQNAVEKAHTDGRNESRVDDQRWHGE